MAHDRDKHWDFFVSEHDVEPVLAQVMARLYPAGATAPGRDRWGNEGRSLNEERARETAAKMASLMSCGAVDFHHDPEHGEEPAVVRADVERACTQYLDGYYADPDDVARLKALFNPDADGFEVPVDRARLIADVTEAITTGVADGSIEVSADEPYDSCRGCFGYHNVNYDCS